MLLGNFDMLMAFIDKHCHECPQFAQEFEQLNRDVAQRTMEKLQGGNNGGRVVHTEVDQDEKQPSGQMSQKTRTNTIYSSTSGKNSSNY